MKIKSLEELNALHVDVLAEVGNIGSGNAATALATMLNKVVKIEIPNIVLLDYDKVAEILGGTDQAAISMSVGLEGDLEGLMLHIISVDFASSMVNTFYKKEIHGLEDVNDMDVSVMQEMSNITTAAYVNSVSTLINGFINICPPEVNINRIGKILETARKKIGNPGQQVLYIDEKLVIEETEIKSSMIMMLTLNSMNELFKSLEIDVYENR
ncbi:MAG: chemotaxis protein CheC [Eubacterium sp.]|nr:chemotaxis protein CheC [Eubacterium sp.]